MNASVARRYRIFWPLVMVCVGAGLLLAATGWLSTEALGRLAATWPVFLILGGVSLVLRRYLSPAHAAVALAAAFVTLCSGATAYALAGPTIGGATKTVVASAPRGVADAASLTVNASAATLDVMVADTGGNLFVARVTGNAAANPIVHVDAATNAVIIDTDTHDWWAFRPTQTAHVSVTLSQDVGWSITVNAASADGTMRLHGAARSVTVNAAADNTRLMLGSPVGSVPIQLNGAALTASISIATGVPAQVTASGVAASITVDGRSWSGIGQQAWSDPGFAGASDRYDISANGASAQIRVTHDAGDTA